jgi:hypothetical protein
MRFRKLRIAWSVFWGLAAVLLIVLWVRSYWWVDQFVASFGRYYVGVGVTPGALGVGVGTDTNVEPWTLGEPNPAEEWLAAVVLPNGQPYPSRVWGVFDFNTSDGVNAEAPFWFLILLLSTAATAPWLLRRFSLRTLLIVMTLVAVALGIIVCMSRTG